MKRFLLTIIAAVGAMSAYAQFTPNKIVVPDIEGYQTLTGDFHIHTVFSDASVWPATRVQEAIWEGLDVIAITEHIDTRHQKMVNNGTLFIRLINGYGNSILILNKTACDYSKQFFHVETLRH